MADFNVIADVSDTLRQVLTDGLAVLAPPPVAQIHDLQGAIPLAPARLTLFLFEVVEDPSTRNRPHRQRDVPPNIEISRPPQPLLLRYLLTAWSNDPMTDQRILGRTLQILYNGAVLAGPDLRGVLAGTAESLKVNLAPLTLEERTRVWHAVQKPYRLSLTYEVRVVNLDSIPDRQVRPVLQRSLQPQEPDGPPEAP